jgi:anti-sigma-K factor RskA
MSPHEDRFFDLLPAYALDALDADERAELERHLEAGCSTCESELRLWRDDVEALAASLAPVEPAQTTRARVLALAAPQPVVEGASRRSMLAGLAAAAGLAALLVGGFMHLGLRREVASMSQRLGASAERLERLEAELGSTRGELARLRLIGGIAASPETRLVALAGLVEPGEAFGQALVDPIGRRAVFYAYGLRPTEEGRTYQLWFIAGGTPVSAGVFQVDSEGRAVLLVENVAPVDQIEAWAVTVEPAGGVPQPTGPMVLKG